jgi:hypothetical protein
MSHCRKRWSTVFCTRIIDKSEWSYGPWIRTARRILQRFYTNLEFSSILVRPSTVIENRARSAFPVNTCVQKLEDDRSISVYTQCADGFFAGNDEVCGPLQAQNQFTYSIDLRTAPSSVYSTILLQINHRFATISFAYSIEPVECVVRCHLCMPFT